MYERWQFVLESSSQQGNTSEGNLITHIREENTAIRMFWESIARAKKRVWMTMYTLQPDNVGRCMLEKLTQAAKRGCEVILLCDYIGSFNLRDRDVAPLREAGGQVWVFNPLWPWCRQGPITMRNHRKIIITDDDIGYCGGMNIGDKYVGDTLGPSDRTFDDTVLRLEGPCVHDLAGIFLDTLRETAGLDRALPPRPEPRPDGALVQIVTIDPRRKETSLQQALGDAVANTRERCFITTPYFIPPVWLLDALEQASRRGADIRIVTAGRSSVPAARAAGRHCYGPLLRRGVRIYEQRECTLHSKAVTIDGEYGSVGSYNMDEWTSRHLLEVNVVVLDTRLAHSLEEEFFDHVALSEEVTPEAWESRSSIEKLGHWAAFRLACL